MINLLPPDEKRQLQAARSNNLLIRYNFFLIGAVVFLLLSIGFVYVYLNNTKASAELTINENKTRVANFAATEAETKQFRANLATAKQILDREVTYTKVILSIAKLMPSGTVLENLSLDSTTFGTQTPIVAKAKRYEDALALKNAFQNSPLFTNVHFASITSGEGSGAYPITVTINVTIKKDAAKQ